MIEKIVELIRRFAPMSSRTWDLDFLQAGPGRPQRWHGIEEEYRVLIIERPGFISQLSEVITRWRILVTP
jgi:hypothetical protein